MDFLLSTISSSDNFIILRMGILFFQKCHFGISASFIKGQFFRIPILGTLTK